MQYFLDVFTPGTWQAFCSDGARVTAFSRNRSRAAESVLPGDRFLCYLKGRIAWVGALEAQSRSYISEEPLWQSTDWPVRVDVKPIVMLSAEFAMPMMHVAGKVTFVKEGAVPATYAAHLQGSPRRLIAADGEAIFRALRAHEDGVQASTSAEELPEAGREAALSPRAHHEMQLLLVRWGLATGCTVWVPRADRARVQSLAEPREVLPFLPSLPNLFGGHGQSRKY